MMNFDSLHSMKAKILFRFGLITLVLLLVGGVFVASTERVKKGQARVTEYTDDKMLLQKAVADHYQWTVNLNAYINYDTEFTGSTDPKTCDFGKFLYSDEVQSDPEWRDFIQKIEPLHNKIHAGAVDVMAQTSHDGEQEIYWNEVRPALDEMIEGLYEFIDLQGSRVTDAEQDAGKVVNFQMVAVLFQVLVLLALLLNTFGFFRREVIKPIVKIREGCGRLEQGMLSIDFTTDCKNTDIRQLCDSLNDSICEIKKYVVDIDRAMAELSNHNFNVAPSQPFIGDFKSIEDSIGKMITIMSGALGEMDMAADTVSASSEQMAGSSQILAQGASEQASSIEELSATVEEISKQIQLNAVHSDKASEMANGATSAISASNDQMQRLMVSMHDIDNKSKEISKIIQTIEDIAFQTNILALNAAVEAARAGTAGKGFAVVADEVRSLAAKSAEAANNTTELIESSIRAIRGGVELAQATADDLLNVVDGANATTEVIMEITKATKAQSQSLSQITQAVGQISSVVQQNSATSEECAATSEELSGQAQRLKDLIGQFQLLEEPLK